MKNLEIYIIASVLFSFVSLMGYLRIKSSSSEIFFFREKVKRMNKPKLVKWYLIMLSFTWLCSINNPNMEMSDIFLLPTLIILLLISCYFVGNKDLDDKIRVENKEELDKFNDTYGKSNKRNKQINKILK